MSKKKPSQASPISVASPPRIYVLKITLAEVDPPVWRRLEIEEDSPIDFAATAIRSAFGWSCTHGSEFTIKRRRYGDSTGWLRFDPEQEYERGWREIMKRNLSRKQEQIELDKLGDEIEALTAGMKRRRM